MFRWPNTILWLDSLMLEGPGFGRPNQRSAGQTVCSECLPFLGSASQEASSYFLTAVGDRRGTNILPSPIRYYN